MQTPSLLQLPASSALLQSTSLEQHAPPEQVPQIQLLRQQQSLGLRHALPLPMQALATAHLPWLQVFEQQSLASVQPASLWLQASQTPR
jgi:hypothetical protein